MRLIVYEGYTAAQTDSENELDGKIIFISHDISSKIPVPLQWYFFPKNFQDSNCKINMTII